MRLSEDTTGEQQVQDVIDDADVHAVDDADAVAVDEAFVKAPPSNADADADAVAVDEAFAKAPPSDDPACFRQADKLRDPVETWVDGVRADAGRPALSAAMFRRRRAIDHRDMALEFAQRRKVAVGLEEDELCRSVQAAMDAHVIGCCAYCGGNFSVVPVVDMPEVGVLCGVCGRKVRLHDPTPLVRDPPADAEERWKGWLPW